MAWRRVSRLPLNKSTAATSSPLLARRFTIIVILQRATSFVSLLSYHCSHTPCSVTPKRNRPCRIIRYVWPENVFALTLDTRVLQYLLSYASATRNSTAMHFQTVNPYAALVATASPEHDGRSSSSGSPPSSGSSASLSAYEGGAAFPAAPFRSQAQAYSGSRTPQQHVSFDSTCISSSM